jgi:hypothetical protein
VSGDLTLPSKWGCDNIWDAEEEEGNVGEVLEGVGQKFFMILTLHDFAHQYVLSNILMSPWLE